MGLVVSIACCGATGTVCFVRSGRTLRGNENIDTESSPSTPGVATITLRSRDLEKCPKKLRLSVLKRYVTEDFQDFHMKKVTHSVAQRSGGQFLKGVVYPGLHQSYGVRTMPGIANILAVEPPSSTFRSSTTPPLANPRSRSPRQANSKQDADLFPQQLFTAELLAKRTGNRVHCTTLFP